MLSYYKKYKIETTSTVWEIKYVENDIKCGQVICSGMIDDKETVEKWVKSKLGGNASELIIYKIS